LHHCAAPALSRGLSRQVPDQVRDGNQCVVGLWPVEPWHGGLCFRGRWLAG